MGVKRGQTLEVTIEKTVFGGQGLVRVDGLAVFVAGSVPGDRALIRVGRKKKSWAKAVVVELLEPSPLRVEAPCPWFGWCGGCKWQFIDYATQLQFKKEHVAESLAHIAGLENVPVADTLAAPEILGYRNKMEFSCADRRWLLPEEMEQEGLETNFAVGLHVPGTFYKVLDIDACLLQPEEGNRILAFTKGLMKSSGFPAYGLHSHEGFWRFVMIRHSRKADQWMVNLVTAGENREVMVPIAEKIMEVHPKVVSVVNNVTTRKSAVAAGDYEILLAGEDHLADSLGPFEFNVSANSFFQTNTRQARALYDIAKDFARLDGSQTVVDLYCGTGTIAIWLAAQAKEVVGVEINPTAVEDAEKNCVQNSVTNCRFMVGDINKRLDELPQNPDVVVLDPPRAGMHPKVCERVAEMNAQRVVYVSCNPSTLARDMELLAQTYKPVKVQPVDMFPQTPHIEAVALLERE